ncbi:MAG: diacylglycerol kinase [Halothiobacillaceae bacterium]
MASEHRGWRRIVNATGYSMKGFRAAYRKEEAFRQETWLAVVAVPLGLWLGDTGIEKALLAGAILMVLIVELLNTGIENAVDRVGTEPHKLSGRAKDVGSAAVFLSLVVAALVWGLVLFF